MSYIKCNHGKFLGTFARDKMPLTPKRPCGFIVNTDPSKEKGEHWNAIMLLPGGKGEFFNSFGFPPLHPTEQKYMRNECPSGFEFSSRTIQDPLSDRCGLFCIDYLSSRLNGESFSQFLNHYKNSHSLEENEQQLEKRIYEKFG